MWGAAAAAERARLAKAAAGLAMLLSLAGGLAPGEAPELRGLLGELEGAVAEQNLREALAWRERPSPLN
jgi:hypothetical protein